MLNRQGRRRYGVISYFVGCFSSRGKEEDCQRRCQKCSIHKQLPLSRVCPLVDHDLGKPVINAAGQCGN